jgi:hypothetical protein
MPSIETSYELEKHALSAAGFGRFDNQEDSLWHEALVQGILYEGLDPFGSWTDRANRNVLKSRIMSSILNQ